MADGLFEKERDVQSSGQQGVREEDRGEERQLFPARGACPGPTIGDR